ncbi:unnamed protein product, partial [Staurois parvus]
MTGPRRLRGHLQSAALLVYAQCRRQGEKAAGETSGGEDTDGPRD